MAPPPGPKPKPQDSKMTQDSTRYDHNGSGKFIRKSDGAVFFSIRGYMMMSGLPYEEVSKRVAQRWDVVVADGLIDKNGLPLFLIPESLAQEWISSDN